MSNTSRHRMPMFTASIGLVAITISARAETPPPHFTDAIAASTDSTESAARLFERRIWPLFHSKCLGCHGRDAKDIKAGLDLRTRHGALTGGESGRPAVMPGRTEASPLFVGVTWREADFQMPPKESERLTDEQVEWLRRWIDAGAPWPEPATEPATKWQIDNSADGVTVRTSGGRTAEWDRRPYTPEDLWAYRPIRRPKVPTQDGEAKGESHPIDAFINRRLAEAQLEPAGSAGKRTLIRRVTYDLTGLPPTPDEVDAFVADDSLGAFEQVVDRLLRSPHYGEQQARRWLDVVRYADTSGLANDFERPNAWRYRDYVVRSFNGDKPFDRFIVEQIAGDELDSDDLEMRIAVGYLRMGPWEHTGMSVAAVTRQQFLDDVTNAVGETFLGQILRCARCHDHKFDPIPTKDYYRVQAVFAPAQFAEPKTPFFAFERTDGFDEGRAMAQRRIDATRAEAREINQKHRRAVVDWVVARGHDAAVADDLKSLPEEQRPPRHIGLSYQDLGVRKALQKHEAYFVRQALRYEPFSLSVYNGPRREYRSNRARYDIPARESRKGAVDVVHILDGGAVEAPTEPVTPGVLSAMHGANDNTTPTAWNTIPEATTGRRLAFANWVASPHNTLTARVIVNRVWQQHFADRGLVGTPNNFGKMGKKPTHPELLDWLATWFVEHGWSIKKLHRLIVTSQVYQRSGRHPDVQRLRQRDPLNERLAVYPSRRLSAEELRDAMLAVSGELNRALGGPSVYPEMNLEAALQPRHIMGSLAPAYQPSPRPEQRHRRTLYAFRMRGLPDPMLEVFNQPNADVSCERRDATVVTPQVFAQFNSQYAHDRALAWAKRLQSCAKDRDEQIALAFRQAFGRSPTPRETARCREHLAAMTDHHRPQTPPAVRMPTSITRSMVEEMTGVAFTWEEKLDVYQNEFVPDAKPADVDADTRALAELCLVLLNANEFVYVY